MMDAAAVINAAIVRIDEVGFSGTQWGGPFTRGCFIGTMVNVAGINWQGYCKLREEAMKHDGIREALALLDDVAFDGHGELLHWNGTFSSGSQSGEQPYVSDAECWAWGIGSNATAAKRRSLLLGSC